MIPESYNDVFYNHHKQMSISSAEEIIPIVLGFVKPHSVLDVGCGIGTWLSVWERLGINDILGIDNEYVDSEKLLINKNNFIVVDLEKGYKSSRKFDIVTCLEVAEHININTAEELIDSICKIGDIILFSAAIPGQEGTLHVNEQYPTYWLNFFIKNNFVPVDCIRKKVWSNERVSTWYRQNILLYVNKMQLDKLDKLKNEAINTDNHFLNIVHPNYFDNKNTMIVYYEKILSNPRSIINYLIKSTFKKIKNKIVHFNH